MPHMTLPTDSSFPLSTLVLGLFLLALYIGTGSRRSSRTPTRTRPSPGYTGSAPGQARERSSSKNIVPEKVPQPGKSASSQRDLTAGYNSCPIVFTGSKFLLESSLSHLPAFQQGRDSEARVMSCIVQVLDDRCFVFRNIVIPGYKEDIDMVVVGPGGVFALEVKTYSGNVRVERGRYYVETGNGFQYRQWRGAGAQIRSNAARLYEFLKQNGIMRGYYVKPLVVLAGKGNVEIVSSGTDVCRLDDLPSKLDQMTHASSLPSTDIYRISKALQSTLVERSAAYASAVH